MTTHECVSVVTLVGELDLAAGSRLDEVFRSLEVDAYEINLFDLSFMDCSGYAEIVTAWNTLRVAGCALRITGARGQPAWLLRHLRGLGSNPDLHTVISYVSATAA